MAVTRIKNNQITDATVVANAKLVDYSISSAKLANNLTYNSSLTITGNLTVQGTTTAVDTVNTLIQDPILVLADGQTAGTPTVDIGILGYRGNQNSSFLGWLESTDTFAAVLSNTTVSNTTVNVNSYANFTASTITAQADLSVIGNIVGAANFSGNVTAPNMFSTGLISAAGNVTGGNLLTGGLISATSTITSAANITGGNLLTGGLISATSTITSAANITGGNILTGGQVSATGNITGGNISTAGTFGAASLSASGNVTGGNLVTAGLVTATGNVTGGNLVTAGLVTSTGNVTGGNILTGGLISATANVTGGNILTAGVISATSTITSAANITGGNILTGGLISATGNITGGNLNISGNIVDSNALTISTGTGDLNLAPSGNVALGNRYVNGVAYPVQDQDAASKIYVDNLVSTAISYHEAVFAATTANLATTTGGTITYNQPGGAGNGIGATITTTGSFNLIDTANVQTANTRILVKNEGNAALNGVYIWSNATVITRSSDTNTYGAGNVDALGLNDYFFVQDGSVNKGSAWIVDAPTGTITFGTSNIQFAQFSSSQTYTANTQAGISLTGTVFSAKVDNNTTAFDVGGNIIVKAGANLTTPNIGAATGTSLSVTANVTGGNVNTGGLITATGNVTGGNILTGGVVSATANVTGGNLLTGGLISATSTITSAANITGGNVLTGGVVSATANVTGGNILTGGLISATSTITSAANITGGNILTGGLISATANVTGGNLITGGLISATSTITSAANITGGNILTGGLISATANVTGGNILTGGLITATGNITGANLILTSGTIDGPASGRITINGSDLDTDFAVDGDTSANVFYVDAGTGTASFGASTQVTNAIVNFATTNSIKVPVGNTAQRPSSGITGMIRFNTTNNAVEVFDNSAWTSVGTPVFTVIADEQFNGDGSTVAFTLSSSQTTNSCIVSINGVVQIPTSAYSVSTTTLTFTEAPASGDLIDVREITTTTTVTSISNTSGNAVIAVSPTAAQIQTTGDIIPTANATANIGSSSFQYNTVFAKATSAQYADLAEKYAADATYDPGTVVMFGGAAEVTLCINDACARVAGVISTNPSYRMNDGLVSEHTAMVALTGRVPTKVTGTVRKGDLMVSAGNGVARAEADPRVGTVIGKALADSEGDAVIEIVVGRV